MENLEELQCLEMLEAILVEHQAFGDSDYIRERLDVCYKRRLHKISAYLPVAGQLLDALSQVETSDGYRIIGDTVVRCATDHALRQLQTATRPKIATRRGLPLDECGEVFRATIRHLKEGRSEGPLGYAVSEVYRLGHKRHHGWVWSDEHWDNVFGRTLRYVVEENYGAPLCAPNRDELAALRKGAQLLDELLPWLSRSALSHAHLIAVFPRQGWEGKASSSQFRLGGTIFLNREMLKNPWWIAEHLLHESLHQKLYDFRHGHTLLEQDSSLEPDSEAESARRVCAIWNIPLVKNSHYWDTRRAVAAFHVYVHLALFCRIAEIRTSNLSDIYGQPRAIHSMTESRRALERAHYLGENIKNLCWEELGLAGRRLIDWLLLVLDGLDPSPPPPGSYIHLLLYRYLNEAGYVAKKAEASLREKGSDRVKFHDTASFSYLEQELRQIIKDEEESVSSVLSIITAEADLRQFNSALAQYPDEELGRKFLEVRRLVAKTIMASSPDGYTLKSLSPESSAPEEIVRQMVERSSERLHRVLAE
jgi:hypothetical protein